MADLHDREFRELREWIESSGYDVVVEATVADFVKLKIFANTRLVQCTLNISLPQGYPDTEDAVCTLSSDCLKPKLVTRLGKLCQSAAKARSGKPQLRCAVEALALELKQNLLIPCMHDIRLLAKHLGNINSEATKETKCHRLKMTTDGTSGKITLHATCRKYDLRIRFVVGPKYPFEPPSVELQSKTFHSSMLHRYENIARDIARRCASGIKTEDAVRSAIGQGEGPRRRKKKNDGAAAEAIASSDIHKIKNDMKFLKKATDLRKVDRTQKQGSKHYKKVETATRRAARKELRKLTRAEVAIEQRLAETAKREKELADALSRGVDLDDMPKHSLLAVSRYLIDSFALFLPVAKCGLCKNKLLPRDPADLTKLFASSPSSLSRRNTRGTSKEREPNAKKPERIYCGHWFHYACIDKALTSPPFKVPCPTCGKRLFHRDWPSDVKKLERRWANEQAKKREMGEISSLLGLDDDDDLVRTPADDPISRRDAGYDPMF
eukprot:g2349.t1